MTGQIGRQRAGRSRLHVVKGTKAAAVVEGHAPAVRVDVGEAAAVGEAEEAEAEVGEGGGVEAH